MSYSIPLGHAAGILAAIYAEGAVYQALSVQNRTLKDGGATIYPSGKKNIYLEHFISQLQQGIQHCTMPPLSTRMLR